MLVRNRMSKKVVAVKPDTTLYEVMKIVEDNKFDGLPIVNNEGKVLGVVDEKIIMREFCACCAQQNQEAGIDTDMPIPFSSTTIAIEPDKRRIAHFLHRRTVEELVLPEEEVIVVDADDPIEHASYLMFLHSIDLLPVMEGDTMVGVLSKGDILQVFDEMFGFGDQGGDRVSFTATDVVGRLADVTGLMKRHEISIGTIVATQIPNKSAIMVVMKVEKGKGDKALEVLKENNFRVQD